VKFLKGAMMSKDKKHQKSDKLGYEDELRLLQIELLKFQNHVKDKGLRVLMLMEGRDAAGKGGTIKRLTEHLNPRGCRIVALTKPSDVEKTQWYFQRYVTHLPSAGEIVIFDRSWYNRAGVEPVMGFCTQAEHKEFLREVPKFEEMIINSGIIFFKIYLSITKEEQKKRFKERLNDPLKQFKISPVDQKAQELWDQYSIAKYSMLLASHNSISPWVIVSSDNKKEARLNVFKFILTHVEYPKKIDEYIKYDKSVVRDGSEEIKRIEEGLNKDKLKSID
jgi:polyphosphate kinase 2